jgi:hypothetical protein
MYYIVCMYSKQSTQPTAITTMIQYNTVHVDIVIDIVIDFIIDCGCTIDDTTHRKQQQ